MSVKHVIAAGAALLFSCFITTETEAGTCIGKHCAIIAATPSPAPAVVVTSFGIVVPVLHPVPGVYCVQPVGTRPKSPYVPLVSVADDLSKPLPGTNASPAASLVEINTAGAGCPVVDPPGAPFVEVDTFSILPGAPVPIVIPSDTVGFLIQF
jgi:hypothetical protein